MTDLVMGLLIGVASVSVVLGVAAVVAVRRLGQRHEAETADLGETVLELRQERADDKETNRRLRHELAANTPDRLIETATAAELERDGALTERDQALEQLNLVQQDLRLANRKLADREAKLRKYREALREIRMSLEAQGLNRNPGPAASMLDTAELGDHPLPAATDGPTVEEIQRSGERDRRPQPEPVDLSAAD